MKSITVTVDEAHLTSIHGVTQQLRSQGMQVDQVLESVGIITGSVPDCHYSALRSIEGVSSVHEQHRFHVPPPDSDVQ
jgi:hypothetical protein